MSGRSWLIALRLVPGSGKERKQLKVKAREGKKVEYKINKEGSLI